MVTLSPIADCRFPLSFPRFSRLVCHASSRGSSVGGELARLRPFPSFVGLHDV